MGRVKGQFYKPAKGCVENPLKDYPVNAKCFCGSNKKFKKCHWAKSQLFCTRKDALHLQKIVDAYWATQAG